VILDVLWLIPALCLAGALANLALGVVRAPKVVVTVVGVGSVGAATVAAYAALWQYLHQPLDVLVRPYFTWISAGSITIDASFQLDPLSAVMVAFVTFVGLLIHLYSVGYMHGESERGYARYFAYLNLFMFAMLLLVLGSNLVVLFVGWEGVGLCSYLLIGYYYTKNWCAAAGSKAFIVNRIGDLGFLIAVFTTLSVFGSTEYLTVFGTAAAHPEQYAAAATVIGLLLFVGAVGKSAQIPLYVWLPDAMAGPTPVSALIHAATMVTAGVYMVVRANVFYRLSPTAMVTVAVVGGVTAIFAATIALVQNDIKKVLAYSTVSQLGYMFLAAGVGAYVVAIFHVVTHAFFKACLFLGSGSVIHACDGEQDMRQMGGLKKHMPTTYWTFFAATLAISGIPLFAGFFSKDEILARAFAAGAGNLNGFGTAYTALWGLGVVAALLTAFYMFRALNMTFRGDYRGGAEKEHHLHESPRTMTLPLIVLGVLSTIGGFVGFPGQLFGLSGLNLIDRFLEPVILPLGSGVAHGAAAVSEHGAHGLTLGVEWLLVLVSVTVAVAGIVIARGFYLGAEPFAAPQRLAARLPFFHRLLFNKYWIDELYGAVIIGPIRGVAEFCWRIVDQLLIDTIFVNGTAFAADLTGDLLRFTTTGNVRNYATAVALAVVALAVLLW
jgi:NADH-quinone oxidoreductase subunit L